MVLSTYLDLDRNIKSIPITKKSMEIIPIHDIEIQNLINVIPPVNHPYGQKRYIITGGPGAGKTTIINALGKKFTVIPEAATTIIEREIHQGISNPWRADDYHIKVNQLNLANQIRAQNLSTPVIFFDRGFLDSLSYILLQKRKLYQFVIDCVQASINATYFEKTVFFIDSLGFIVPGPARNESLEESVQKAACLEKNYKALGYEIIHIPPGSLEERVDLITNLVV